MGGFLEAGAPIYASPSGTGTGVQSNPASLAVALADTRDIYLMDGLYTMDAMTIPAGVTMRPATGARPIISHTDGKPPTVHLNAGATLDGIWIGGAKAATERAITLNNGATVQNCTLFGYYGGIAEGGNTNHQFINNRFVECGTGEFYHDMYISEGHAANACTIQGNIFIGGEGYKVHLFNGVNNAYPSNVKVLNNFFGDVQWGVAVYGQGHTLQDNVLWSCIGIENALVTVNLDGTFDFDHNVIGLATTRIQYSGSAGQSADSNAIVDGAPAETANDPLGTNLVVWQEADIVSNLGNSSANIQAAVDALEAAFAQTVQQVHDDATIEGHFTTLRNALNMWAA